MFEIGSKILCIDASKRPETVEELDKDCPNWVQQGKSYIVRGFNDSDFVVGVLLEEIINPPKYFRLVDKVLEPSFRLDRFRRMQEDEVESEVMNEELTTTY